MGEKKIVEKALVGVSHAPYLPSIRIIILDFNDESCVQYVSFLEFRLMPLVLFFVQGKFVLTNNPTKFQKA